jgi:hypothetical protein
MTSIRDLTYTTAYVELRVSKDTIEIENISPI